MSLPERIPILLYHSVSDEANRAYERFNIAPAALRAHLDVIAGEDFTPITVTTLVEAWKQGRPPSVRRPVVITFDDGFTDFFVEAMPAVLEHGFAATIYVVAGLIGGRATWLQAVGEQHRTLMTKAMVREVSDLGIECGAHGLLHTELDALRRAQAAREITESKSILEDALGRPVLSFAYPYGYHDRWVADTVQAAGYESAVAVRDAMTDSRESPYRLSRLIVTGQTSTSILRNWLHGDGASVAPQRERIATTAARFVRRARVRLAPRPVSQVDA